MASQKYAIAEHDLAAQSEGELSFKAGDRITVLEEGGEGDWWCGDLNGTTGYFPINFCRVEDGPTTTSAPTDTAGHVQFRGRVLHLYVAETDTELPLAAGEVVSIVSEEGGWFYGTNETTGASGFFPSTFVEILDSTEVVASPPPPPPPPPPAAAKPAETSKSSPYRPESREGSHESATVHEEHCYPDRDRTQTTSEETFGSSNPLVGSAVPPPPPPPNSSINASTPPPPPPPPASVASSATSTPPPPPPPPASVASSTASTPPPPPPPPVTSSATFNPPPPPKPYVPSSASLSAAPPPKPPSSITPSQLPGSASITTAPSSAIATVPFAASASPPKPLPPVQHEKGKVTAVAPPQRPGSAPTIYEKPLNNIEICELETEETKSNSNTTEVIRFDFQPYVPYHRPMPAFGEGKMSFGGRPMWTHFAFVDVFVDAFLAKNHSHYKNMSAGPPGVMGLSSALLFVTSVLKSLEKENNGKASYTTNKIISKASDMLDDCSDMCNRFTMATNDPNRLYETILQIVVKLKMMKIGDCFVLPGGWSCTEPLEYHIVLYVITKAKNKANTDVFHFAVVNTGNGLEHHMQQIDPLTGHINQNLAFMFRNIPGEKLMDGGFWFLLYRLLCFPSANTNANALYGILLPWLTGVPLGAEKKDATSSSSAAAEDTQARRRWSQVGDSATTTLAIDWRRPPLSTDSSRCYCILETIFHVARNFGCTQSQGDATLVLIKAHIMRMLYNDLLLSKTNGTSKLSNSESLLIQSACKQMAREAARPDPTDLSGPFLSELFSLVSSIQDMAHDYAKSTSESTKLTLAPQSSAECFSSSSPSSSSVELEGVSGREKKKLIGPISLPNFGRFRKDTDVEHLAGHARIPPIVLPVQLSLVKNQISTYHELAMAMRHCVHSCTLLANQSHLIKNTFALRASLIQHLFLEVCPLPLPCDYPEERLQHDWWNQNKTEQGMGGIDSMATTSQNASAMRYETQSDLLGLLSLLAQHYSAVACSLTVTRSFDATRLCTLAAIAAITDKVMRVVACDIPSQLSLHYSGQAEGPVAAFCFDASQFAIESEFSRFHDPNLAVVRTRLLDYFIARRKATLPDHVIFQFEKSMSLSNGDNQLLTQVSLQMGFNRQPENIARYLSGEDRSLTDLYPELASFRDIVYLFKAMMCPSSASLPKLKAWPPAKARLTWKYNDKKENLEVSGFDEKVLACCAYANTSTATTSETAHEDDNGGADGVDEGGKKKKTWGSTLYAALGLGAEYPRAPPSGADPSVLTGTKINSEDDVLHVRHLPDFEGRLNGRQAELLIQYLTAPYLRIPLVLRLLSDEARVRSLSGSELQGVLDSVIFEPGAWQQPPAVFGEPYPIPSVVPAPTRDHLATPLGLLFNELIYSPATLLHSMERLVDTAVEMDTGRYGSSSCLVILYVLRLSVRLEGYANFIIQHAEWRQSNDGVTSSGARNYVRGLEPDLEVNIDSLARVKSAAHMFKKRVEEQCVPMLERWLRLALKDQAMSAACTIYAHLAYRFKNRLDSEMDAVAVMTLQVAQIFLNIHHHFRLDLSNENHHDMSPTSADENTTASSGGRGGDKAKAWDDTGLGIPETEIFDLFQRYRHFCLNWLSNHPAATNEIMENIVKVVTLMGRGRELAGLVDKLTTNPIDENSLEGLVPEVSEVEAEVGHRRPSMVPAVSTKKMHASGKHAIGASVSGLKAREWKSLTAHQCFGRFVPDTENEDEAEAFGVAGVGGHVSYSHHPNENYETWLRRVTTIGVGTEINVQLGEFTMKKHRMVQLGADVRAQPEFQCVFGDLPKEARIQCAEVKHTTERSWWRLVGRRHDVMWWLPDTMRYPPPLPKHPDGNFRYAATGMPEALLWIAKTFEPIRRLFFNDIQAIDLVGPPQSACGDEGGQPQWALLVAHVPNKQAPQQTPTPSRSPAATKSTSRARASITDKRADGGEVEVPVSSGSASSNPNRTLKEIVVFRDPEVVHVYNVVEYGRRFYRSLIYSSDACLCLDGNLSCFPAPHSPNQPMFHAGDPKLEYFPNKSLVITRNLTTTTGPQTFLPSRLLTGLLPSVLLDDYSFWQSDIDPGFIVGYQLVDDPARPLTRLELTLNEGAFGDKDGFCSSLANAVVRRVQLRRQAVDPTNTTATNALNDDEEEEEDHHETETEEDNDLVGALAPPDLSVEPEVLINLMYNSSQASPLLHQLRSSFLAKLDDLSHVLVWSTTPPAPASATTQPPPPPPPPTSAAGRPPPPPPPPSTAGTASSTLGALSSAIGGAVGAIGAAFTSSSLASQSIARRKLLGGVSAGESREVNAIEFPRLKLKFLVKYEANGELRLESVEHKGLVYVPQPPAPIAELINGIPHAIVLLNKSSGEYSVLVPATARPLRPTTKNELFSSTILLDRRSADWHAKLNGIVLPPTAKESSEVALPQDSSAQIPTSTDDNEQQRHFLYPIHGSLAFLFSPSLASSLFLLLMRFMNRNYEAVFRIADSCVSDTDLRPMEAQIFAQLRLLKDDHHPDAHACRLKISLATLASRDRMPCDWSIEEEFTSYVIKHGCVSAVCRLTMAEEADLLDAITFDHSSNATRWWSNVDNVVLYNRRNFIKAALDGTGRPFQVAYNPCILSGSKTSEVGGAGVTQGTGKSALPMFDSIVDKSILSTKADSAKSFLANFTTVTYARPEEHVGAQCITFLNKVLDHGLKLSGGSDSLGFLFFYELLTDTLRMRLLTDDKPFLLAGLLIRFLPFNDWSHTSELMSILRAIAEDDMLSNRMPKFKDDRRVKWNTMLPGMDPSKKLMKAVSESFAKETTLIAVEKKFSSFEAPSTMVVCSAFELQEQARCWQVPRAANLGCKKRALRSISIEVTGVEDVPSKFSLDQQELLAHVDVPLIDACNHFVEFSTRAERNEASLATTLPFDISRHPASKSHVAKDMINRMETDVQEYGKKMNSGTKPKLKGYSDYDLYQLATQLSEAVLSGNATSVSNQGLSDNLNRMIEQLTALQSYDAELIKKWRPMLQKLTLYTPPNSEEGIAFNLAQYSGFEAKPSFELSLQLLLSSTGDEDLTKINPHLSSEQRAAIRSLASSVLLASNREAHAARTIATAKDLWRAIQVPKPGKPASTSTEIILLADTLATMLATKRYIVDKKTESSGFICDPRFLVFEFIYSILLRQAQVHLVRSFSSSLAEGSSHCEQMIMGGGKTTVVAPLLALMLADGNSLVVQVVPTALLEFSRSTMRERFSAVITKSIYTFQFDRYSEANSDLVAKLERARRSRSVMCTSPTALKSFVLKFLLLSHDLDISHRVSGAESELAHDKKTGFFNSLLVGVGLSMGEKSASYRLSPADEVNHRRQLDVCKQVLDMFRSGALLLDEVDLILHPLKSELNWPLGRKEPLDFTRSRVGDGLRWHIPFYLLDAVLNYSEDCMVSEVAYSKEAMAVLKKLRIVLEEGKQAKVVQTTPHLVILSRPFYNKKLKPLLARWALIWLLAHGCNGISSSDILEYLELGPNEASAAAAVARSSLSDDHMKMLNLTRDWLNSLLPFCLAKIDRVSFGLLTPADLRRALERDAKMPRTRKLLAVPFVGKDVPSPASEFAHPDVVIGMTVLAYRYEGLRWGDFTLVLGRLFEDMSNEEGDSYGDRPSCAKFARWIALAGGRVRRTTRANLLNELEETTSMSYRQKLLDEEMYNDLEIDTGDDGLENGSNFESALTVAGCIDEVWPLQLINLRDKDQMSVLFKMLHRLPHLVSHYLDSFIFPETCAHQGLKLSACGQELGGDLLFDRRLGFSGTPSDLLPVELGKCQYERGADGKMINVLTDTNVMSCVLIEDDWTVESLLLQVATQSYHALIDTGALITGLTNLQVAKFLLERGLEGMEGVVFLDEKDRKMMMLRDGMVVVPMEQCGIEKAKRFSFYDQVHTTGMDIKQSLDAQAALTLGKDMTWRDYAQGAFRMRGIGAGQKVELLCTPEVKELIHTHLASGLGLTGPKQHFEVVYSKILPVTSQPYVAQLLIDVAAWLVVNQMRSEKVQFNLLCEQNVCNIWRKRAFHSLNHNRAVIGKGDLAIKSTLINNGGTGNNSSDIEEQLGWCMDSFRERIDFEVENTVPHALPFAERIQLMVDAKNAFLIEDYEKNIANKVLGYIEEAENIFAANSASSNSQSSSDAGVTPMENPSEVAQERAFGGEQVQEQEAEAENEVEQMQEVEEEAVMEEEPAEYVKKTYSRDDELPTPWNVSALGEVRTADALETELGFYAMSRFAVLPKITKVTPAPIKFPDFMLVSKNHFKPKWLKTHRRLKNVIVNMEWVPDCDQLTPLHKSSADITATTNKDSEQRLRNSLTLLVANGGGDGAEQAMQAVFDAIGLKPEDCVNRVAELKALTAQALTALKKSPATAPTPGAIIKPGDGELAAVNALYPLVESWSLLGLQKPRYTVVVSLLEAEMLRGILHKRGHLPLLANRSPNFAAVSLQAGGLVLDATLNFRQLYHNPANSTAMVSAGGGKVGAGAFMMQDVQSLISNACLRFMDSETDCGEAEALGLIRGIQSNPVAERLRWFNEIRECRRRVKVRDVLKDTSLGKGPLTTPDEYHVLQFIALKNRISVLLALKGLYVLDAFRAFDSDFDGQLSCSELYGGLEWLGLELAPENIYDLVKRIDSNGDGLVSMADFKTAFHRKGEDVEGGNGACALLADDAIRSSSASSPTGTGDENLANSEPRGGLTLGRASMRNLTIPPKRIKELFQASTGEVTEGSSMNVTLKDIKGMKLKTQIQSNFQLVWDSRSIGSKVNISTWEPSLQHKKMVQRNRDRVCLGHYAVVGLRDPSKDKALKNTTMALEITDTAVTRFGSVGTSSPHLDGVIERLLPHPVQFKQMWNTIGKRTENHLYVWRAIPPSPNFVALGMIATQDEDPPPVTAMRCVPLRWCNPNPTTPRMIWDDAGTGGKRGSLWVVNSMGFMAVGSKGVDPPKEPYYELASDRFFLTSEDLAVLNNEHHPTSHSIDVISEE